MKKGIVETYLEMTDAIILVSDGRYVIETPENTEVFADKQSMMDFIRQNLAYIAEDAV